MSRGQYLYLIWPLNPSEEELKSWFPPEPPEQPILPKPSFLRKWLQPIWPIDSEEYDLSESDDIKEDAPTVNYEDHPDWTDVYFEESDIDQYFDEDRKLGDWMIECNRDFVKSLGLTIFASPIVYDGDVDDALENGYFPYDPENKIEFPDDHSYYHDSYFPPEEFIKQTELFIDILKNGDPEQVKEIIDAYEDIAGEVHTEMYYKISIEELITKLETINNNAKIAKEKGINVMAFCTIG
ncbi:MAG: hypothetical protein GY804_04520 [Alphaproteobacteria bacterium]|nr:hypothetical protein [Alphaproteobacteria bacterium]